ncbi:MAG: hypothetical protein QNJ67_16190 [Kiloniellales bacterium]|nr:hypothetical protein [Kiloniellales bacterium]
MRRPSSKKLAKLDRLGGAGPLETELRLGESIGWTIRLTRGRVVDVTRKHVVLSEDSLGVLAFDDGEALSIEGVRRVGW